jgi:hypothetical protein
VPAQFDPDVVATARRYDRETIARRGRAFVEFVFDRAHLAQRAQRVGREQLRQHALHGAEAEALLRELDWTAGGNDIRLLAHVQDEGITVTADDCGQERIYERHWCRAGLCARVHGASPCALLQSPCMTCFGPS